MKIRTGFVSNSSSSSFIVQVHPNGLPEGERQRLITQEQESTLRERGFKPTWICLAMQLEALAISQEDRCFSDSAEQANCFGLRLGYHVLCNEDEVIDFLLENKIPFKAACQYGHECIFWDGKEDSYQVIRNPGAVADMYGLDSCYSEFDEGHISERVSIEEHFLRFAEEE